MPAPLAVTARIPVPPREVYDVIADYRDGHARILPRPPFVGLEVEEGGVGAGTRIRVDMRALGRSRSFRAEVTEPEPGRVLVETNDTGYVTTFVVDPDAGGRGSVVTITTVPPDRPGLVAGLERWLARRLLRRTFEDELALLAEVAGSASSERGPAA